MFAHVDRLLHTRALPEHHEKSPNGADDSGQAPHRAQVRHTVQQPLRMVARDGVPRHAEERRSRRP